MVCPDPDCREPKGTCSGNKLELFTEVDGDDAAAGHGAQELQRVRIKVVHHKTDRRESHQGPLEYEFPAGPLTDLLLFHIKEGHRALTGPFGGRKPLMFNSSAGNEFSCVTFCQYWQKAMRDMDTMGQEYFCPSLARTMWVEDYTGENGVDPEMWDGAAAVMGNSVRVWVEAYNPSRKRRAAQKAVNVHEGYVARRLAALAGKAPAVTVRAPGLPAVDG